MPATPENPHDVVFLFDCDNTLLDNDHVLSDLHAHMMREFGAENSVRYWEIFEDLRASLGYADYLGALQRYRLKHPRDTRLLLMSSFLIDYPFANRLFPGALDTLHHLSLRGPTVILSDGDVVFQPRKISRFGLWDEVEGRVLIYIHKDVDARLGEGMLPGASLRDGGRQAAHSDRDEEVVGRHAYHGVSVLGALCVRPERNFEQSACRYHGRAYRRSGELRRGTVDGRCALRRVLRARPFSRRRPER